MKRKLNKNLICLSVSIATFIVMMTSRNFIYSLSILYLFYTAFKLLNTILYKSNPTFWKSVNRRKQAKNITNTIYDLKLLLPNVFKLPRFRNVDNGILIFDFCLIVTVISKSNVYSMLVVSLAMLFV